MKPEWVRCKGGARHRFGDSNTCTRCGFNRWNTSFKPSSVAAPPPEEKRSALPLTGTEVKLQHVTTLVTSYLEARDELTRFMGQHAGGVKFEDPLEEMTAAFLKTLYEDYGRELFWKAMRNDTERKDDVGKADLDAASRTATERVRTFGPLELPEGVDFSDLRP